MMGGGEVAQCPCTLLPSSCPSSMASQSSALGITNKQMPFFILTLNWHAFFISCMTERQTGVHVLTSFFFFFFFNNSSRL